MPESAKPNSPCADLPPELANHPKYSIVRELGRGGMGVVYQARQTGMMDRQVVIKVINRSLIDNPEVLARFRREVQAASQLSHPNIVTAHDAEVVGDLHLLVMEFVPGQNLADVLATKGPLPVTSACHYVRQAVRALQHAYERGMVHRDIKPENLMLTPQGQIKVLDFGIAKVVSEQGAGTGLTASNSYVGTPEYSAPEQITDARSADIRADLYSLGCTLYCLLAGRPPFQEATAMKTLLAHLQKEPPPLAEPRPDVPEGLCRVVARLLAKEPGQRYQTPSEVVQALAPFVKGARKPSPPPLPPPKRRQHLVTPQVVQETMTESDATIAQTLNRAGPQRSRKLLAAALAVLLLTGLAGLCAFLVLRGKTHSGGDDKPEPPDEPDRRLVGLGSSGKPPYGGDDKPQPLEGTVHIVFTKVKEAAGLDLVRIPAGEFYMGSEKGATDAKDDEKPQHKVRISGPFWLGKYKVTVGQFKRFVRATDYETEGEKAKERWTWRKPGVLGRSFDQTDEHPVVCVSWNDAKAYCGWLAEKTSLNVRLPREAEWEYSCRARPTTKDWVNTKYYFGDNLADLGVYAWYAANTKPYGTSPCGQKKPNAFGLYDMHGLVWEWCDDGKRTYTDATASDPVGAGESRVIRGGSFESDPLLCHAAYRYDLAPSKGSGIIGFRVLVSR